MLEYIECDGNQYIDTGLKQELTLDMDIQFLSRSNGQFMGHSTSGGYYFGVNASGYYNVSGGTHSLLGTTRRTIHVESIGTNLTLTAGGSTISSSRSSFSPTYNFFLLGGPSGTGFNGYKTSAKLYSCKIYDTGGTLIRDYVPALRSDGIAGLYEAVNDTFYPSDGSSNFTASPYSVENIAVQTTVTGTYKIPYGTSYAITASAVSGYTTPSTYGRTADMPSIVVGMVYIKGVHSGTQNPSAGIYIQDTDGYCHTSDAWTGDYTPNGVAVITSKCSFVIELSKNRYIPLGHSISSVPSGVTITTLESTAIADYNGKTNSELLLSAGSLAIDPYVRNIFPNGKTGYMPAAGEVNAIVLNQSAIDTALLKAGGTIIPSDYVIRSSTFYDDQNYWIKSVTEGWVTYNIDSPFQETNIVVTTL